MKRSEMIKAIAKEFYAMTAHAEQFASETLAWFEAQGMLPPGYWTDWDREHQEYVNEWEPEDEAK